MIKLKKTYFSLLIFSAIPAFAADYSQFDIDKINNDFERKKYSPVIVDLTSKVSLYDIKNNFSYVSESMKLLGESLISELGENIITGTYWNNKIGQVGFYIKPEALPILKKTQTAYAFRWDSLRKERVKSFELDGSIEAVENEIIKNGKATVEIFFNTDEFSYKTTEQKTIYNRNKKASNSIQELSLPKLSEQAKNTIISNKSLQKPSTIATLDLADFYTLIENKKIKSIKPQKFIDKRKTQWPDLVFEKSANKNELFDISIQLRGGEFFTAKTGHLSKQELEIQKNSLKHSISEIIKNAGIEKTYNHSDILNSLGIFNFKLSRAEIISLYKKSDNRILSVIANQPVASLSLNSSTSLINMPPAWNLGYTAPGQNIIIIDNGVRTDHVMFNNKIVTEACFGTNYSTFSSICPNANSKGDSPLGLSGSAAPYTNEATCQYLKQVSNNYDICSHGTHVAGIAAGKNSTSVPLRGVASSAGLIPVQIASWGTLNGNPAYNIFNDDIKEALSTVYSSASAGTSNNPYTINMSIGGKRYSNSSDCNSFQTHITTLITNLKSRGVPVITAVGNDSDKSKMSWPACISGAIKVASTNDDGIGNTISGFSNLGYSGNFSGPVFLAPGTNIESASRQSTTSTTSMDGTSQAAPHVAGLYAVLKSAVPGISVDQASSWLMSSSGSETATINFPGYPNQIYYKIKLSL